MAIPETVSITAASPRSRPRTVLTEPRWVRVLLTTLALGFLGLFLLLPLVAVFAEALARGWRAYLAALSDAETWHAIRLTLVVVVASLIGNGVFGVAAAWAIAKFDFRGKSLLLTLIDLPFAVSPVIAGLIFVLLFGARGLAAGRPLAWAWPTVQWSVAIAAGLWLAAGLWRLRRARPGALWWAGGALVALALLVAFGPVVAWFAALPARPGAPAPRTVADWVAAGYDLKVIFATPGIILATMFITFPFVARELIPVMQAQGSEEEEAARSLGAGGFATFWRITLPNIKWGLLYGLILCNARAMGEFGAVSVVSGHIRGQTNTLPLHIEILYNEYQFVAAFACASALSLLALVTLALKSLVEWRQRRQIALAEANATAGIDLAAAADAAGLAYRPLPGKQP